MEIETGLYSDAGEGSTVRPLLEHHKITDVKEMDQKAESQTSTQTGQQRSRQADSCSQFCCETPKRTLQCVDSLPFPLPIRVYSLISTHQLQPCCACLLVSIKQTLHIRVSPLPSPPHTHTHMTKHTQIKIHMHTHPRPPSRHLLLRLQPVITPSFQML